MTCWANHSDTQRLVLHAPAMPYGPMKKSEACEDDTKNICQILEWSSGTTLTGTPKLSAQDDRHSPGWPRPFTQPLGLIQLSQPSLARISCTASTILRCVVIGSATTPRDYRDDESIAKNVFSFDSKSAFNELFLLAWTFLDLYRRYVTAKTWKAKTSGSTSLTGPTSELSTAFTFAAFPIFPLGSFRKIHPDFSAAPEVPFSWNPQSCSSSQIKVLMGVPVECLGCIQKLGTNKVEAKQSDEDPEHCSIAE